MSIHYRGPRPVVSAFPAVLALVSSLLFPLPSLASLSFAPLDGADNSIIGGDEVTGSDIVARTTVAVRSGGGLCSGSIIDDDLILTAAHCVSSASQMTVVFGLHASSFSSDAVTLRVARAVVPDEYKGENSTGKDQYDIGLVRLEGKIPEGYEKAHVLTDPSALRAGETTLLAGYGITDAESHTGSGTLRKTEVAIKDPGFARTEVSLDQTRGHGACHGDSGGPAFIEQGGSLILWGVTNRGFPDDAPDDCAHDAVYTNIAAHAAWLARSAELLHSVN